MKRRCIRTTTKEVSVSFATNGGEVKTATLPPDSHVADVLKSVNYSRRRGDTVRYNGKPVKLGGIFGKLGPVVKEGDKVTVTPNISGA